MNIEAMNVSRKLDDLIVQATEERSHYYVKASALEAKNCITALTAEVERLREALNNINRAVGWKTWSGTPESYVSRLQDFAAQALEPKP